MYKGIKKIYSIIDEIKLNIKNNSIDWKNNDFCKKKAYIFSLLCELSYIPIPSLELKGDKNHRIKIMPSELFQDISASFMNGINIDDIVNNLMKEINISIQGDGEEGGYYNRVNTERFSATLLKFPRNDVLFIAVRGTTISFLEHFSRKKSMYIFSRDILIDLKILKKSLNREYFFHRGFYKEYLDYEIKLYDELRELKNKHKISKQTKIYFTGHSLGGAVSAIFLANLGCCFNYCRCSMDLDFNTGYTFGMPHYFGVHKDTPFRFLQPYHIYNQKDFIPYMLKENILKYICLDYHNPNTEFCLQDGLMSSPRRDFSGSKFSFLKHHGIEEYISYIWALEKNIILP